MVKPNATVFEPEIAAMAVVYSGGGFSNYFAMPEYQKDAVDALSPRLSFHDLELRWDSEAFLVFQAW